MARLVNPPKTRKSKIDRNEKFIEEKQDILQHPNFTALSPNTSSDINSPRTSNSNSSKVVVKANKVYKSMAGPNKQKSSTSNKKINRNSSKKHIIGKSPEGTEFLDDQNEELFKDVSDSDKDILLKVNIGSSSNVLRLINGIAQDLDYEPTEITAKDLRKLSAHFANILVSLEKDFAATHNKAITDGELDSENEITNLDSLLLQSKQNVEYLIDKRRYNTHSVLDSQILDDVETNKVADVASLEKEAVVFMSELENYVTNIEASIQKKEQKLERIQTKWKTYATSVSSYLKNDLKRTSKSYETCILDMKKIIDKSAKLAESMSEFNQNDADKRAHVNFDTHVSIINKGSKASKASNQKFQTVNVDNGSNGKHNEFPDEDTSNTLIDVEAAHNTATTQESAFRSEQASISALFQEFVDSIDPKSSRNNIVR